MDEKTEKKLKKENKDNIYNKDKIEKTEKILKERKQREPYKRKPKTLLNVIFSQKATIILLLVLQFVLIFITFTQLSEHYTYIHVVFSTIAIVLAISILNTNENPAYKLTWIIPMLVLPVFTTVVYILLKNQPGTRKVRNAYAKKCANTRAFLPTDKEVMKAVKEEDSTLYKLCTYIDDRAGYPAYRCEGAEYYPLGEYKFEAMIRELKKAEDFIFMEYFIVDEGEMWSQIMEILLEKVKAGVEIRFLCDGMGSQFTLPSKDLKKLRKNGIKCLIFNKFHPMMSTIQNNRDHRKILVVDGKVAFNGGINLADEYINRRIRFGHWKDTAVMIKGEAVWNYTMMFLQMWEVISGDTAQYDMYRPKSTGEVRRCKGYVIPYSDSPLDDEDVGKLVYMDMINNAQDYVYITTPYFIPDNEMMTALELAAKSGVDVRIITPHIPDKWYIHCITKSYYRDLLAIGVKVYEYTPGFIHAKNFLSDDKKAVVGTINLDYRSLYLHFECATYMYDTECIKDIRADFNDLFENKCHMITAEDCRKISFFSRFASIILRMFAPLL